MLSLGTSFGPYHIIGTLGAGGMGEVYRATDTNLKRAVAIKVLPESVATDRDRLARFQREAEVLAALNHPNIAAIYGLERSGAITALVMELVEGPTLADRIAQGSIPVDEALPIAKQIAEALEAAHEQGIIHRDLKPANIKVRADGTVKVLDFGLAKAVDTVSATAVDATASPTVTSPAMMTGVGILLGTAAYVSPEQARGRSADKRSDIWAFGCVLYEMLTARPVFAGDDVTDTLANVLKREPDWVRLPNDVPPRVRLALRACLQKDRKRRIADVQSVRLALEGAFDVSANDSLDSRAVRTEIVGGRWAIPVLASFGAFLVAGLAAWNFWSAEPTALPVNRFESALSGVQFRGALRQVMAFSPDGRQFVYNTTRGLFLRTLGELDARLVPGTEEPLANPFFSPDGQSVGYFQGNQLKRVAISGGTPVVISAADEVPLGASWELDNTILFAQLKGILRVSATGGTPDVLIPAKEGELLSAPRLLPDGESVLLSVATTTGQRRWDTAQIVVQSLRTGERRVLVEGGSDARYVPTGHLVYAVGDTLFAMAFDLQRLQVNGGPVSIVQGVSRPVNTAAASATANFEISRGGTLVYLNNARLGPAIARRILAWVNRQGQEEPLSAPPRAYTYPRISPDGTKVAVDVRDQQLDLWVWDIVRQTLTRLTFDDGEDEFPIWFPDSKRIAFSSTRDGGSPFDTTLLTVAADGTGTIQEVMRRSGRQLFPAFVSHDSASVVVFGSGPDGNDDVGIVSLQGDASENTARRLARPLLNTSFLERNPSLSPDGRWMAYESNESGQSEVYVRPFPNVNDGRWQVSTGGGIHPVWARTGRELFYRSGAGMAVVAVQTGSGFAVGNPQVLFKNDSVLGPGGRTYDVAPDGQRFLMIKTAPSTDASDARPARFIIVENWVEELKRLVPTN